MPFEDDLVYIWDADALKSDETEIDACELGYREEYMEGGKEATYAIYKKNPPEEIELVVRKKGDERWLFALNKVRKPYAPSFEDKESWSEPIWGVSGDIVDKQWDATRRSTLTVHRFISEDGVCRTALASISGQGHECREHTCEHAWRFMERFTRE